MSDGLTHWTSSLLAALVVGCASAPAVTSGTDATTTLVTSGSERVVPYEIVDAMPAFWAFWDRARGHPSREAFTIFEETLLAAHPDVYQPAVLGLSGGDEALYQRFEPWFATLPERIDAIRRVDSSFRASLHDATRRFMDAIPELTWDGKVFVMVSLDSFNGAGRMVGGETALLFGLDVIAQGGVSMPPEVLVAHELFHMHQVFPDEPSMASAMWVEGLAVYASEVINPSASVDAIMPESHLHDPEHPQLIDRERAVSFATGMAPYERALARELLDAFDSLSEETYAAFFLGRASAELGERPVRSAYYFGYRVARELAQGRSLHALSQLDPSVIEPDIRRAMERIADGS